MPHHLYNFFIETVAMANGKIQRTHDAEFYGENQSNLHRIFTTGQLQMGILIAFVQYMNSTVVSGTYLLLYLHICSILIYIMKHLLPKYLGEDNNGMSFQGADEELLRRGLAILERQGKCTMFKGETSEEDGIKFF